MESVDSLVGKTLTLPSLFPVHMKRKPLFRKRRTNYKVIQVEDPYKKLEVLICMAEARLSSLRKSIDKDERKKIKITKEISRHHHHHHRHHHHHHHHQQKQQHDEVESSSCQQQQQQNEVKRRSHQHQQQQQVEVNEHNNNNNNNHDDDDQDVWRWEGPPPEWIVKAVEKHNGENLKYFFRKVLTVSDVEGQQNRLLPTRKDMRQVVIPYLTAEERSALEAEEKMKVLVVDERGTQYEKMMMRFYKSLTAHRIIGSDWSKFVKNNSLEPDKHEVFVWGFRVGGKLSLAFHYAVTDS